MQRPRRSSPSCPTRKVTVTVRKPHVYDAPRPTQRAFQVRSGQEHIARRWLKSSKAGFWTTFLPEPGPRLALAVRGPGTLLIGPGPLSRWYLPVHLNTNTLKFKFRVFNDTRTVCFVRTAATANLKGSLQEQETTVERTLTVAPSVLERRRLPAQGRPPAYGFFLP